jgi:undecaprenyl diphosphate synthase
MIENNIPHHVVIIPDGNRRWAEKRNLSPWQGHEAGAKNTEALIRAARELGIRELSFWGSSLENLTKRPLLEKKALLEIYQKNFTEILQGKEVQEGLVKIRIIGRWREHFPQELVGLLERVEQETKNNTEYGLNFFLAYSGDDDMRGAIQRLVDQAPLTVTNESIKASLLTKDLSPVDYLIRTGGDPHLSAGFLMWDIANAELFFSDDLYPDFGPEAFAGALALYADRARRGGK